MPSVRARSRHAAISSPSLDGHGLAVAGVDVGEDQEVAQRLGHAQTGGHGGCALPFLRCGGTLLERAHDWRASLGLGRDHPRPLAADEAHRLQLLERLPHADQADAAAGGVHDHVGQRALHLLPQLVAHRLLALDAVRLLQRGDLEPPVLRRLGGDERAAVGDQPVDQPHVGAAGPAIRGRSPPACRRAWRSAAAGPPAPRRPRPRPPALPAVGSAIVVTPERLRHRDRRRHARAP